jgi:hypothetical protein
MAVDGEADGLDLGGCGRRDGHDCLRISSLGPVGA